MRASKHTHIDIYVCMYVCMYVCACVCVLFTLPLEWSGRNNVLFTLPVKQCYFLPPRVCGNVIARSYVRGAWGGGGGEGGI